MNPTAARVLTLNNRAVAMLRHGSEKLCLRMLKEAMETLYQQAREDEDSSMVCVESTPSAPPSSPIGKATDRGQMQLRSLDESEWGVEEDEEEDYSALVHSAAIKLNADGRGNVDDDYRLVYSRALVLADSAAKHPDVILSCVLYNLGLVSHLRGICTQIEARFRTALRLYEMAFEIIQLHDDQGIFDDILILALVNNMVYSQQRLGNPDEARKQNEFLRALVGIGAPASSHTGACPDYCLQVDESDYFFFYLNALEERVSAPAA
ncbi:expressed unknown protein [Seminavis robusta]|uniref:Uncharacterized protein n=1 Tax=Seminavis robusta TaxID=568900 RepID=A0A9N8EV74_9STRA|nr:expressed unknown protein [Seminavis robusta]|eukprot:Sro1975_g308830.1 n/a (265) ;mRNA; r:17899-18693